MVCFFPETSGASFLGNGRAECSSRRGTTSTDAYSTAVQNMGQVMKHTFAQDRNAALHLIWACAAKLLAVLPVLSVLSIFLQRLC